MVDRISGAHDRAHSDSDDKHIASIHSGENQQLERVSAPALDLSSIAPPPTRIAESSEGTVSEHFLSDKSDRLIRAENALASSNAKYLDVPPFAEQYAADKTEWKAASKQGVVELAKPDEAALVPVRFEQVAEFAQTFQAPASKIPTRTDHAIPSDNNPLVTGTPQKLLEQVRYEQVADFAQPFQAPVSRVPIRTDNAIPSDNNPLVTGTPQKLLEQVRYEQVADFAQPFQVPASKVPIRTDNAATIDAPTLKGTPSKIVEPVRYEQVADFAQPFQVPASKVPIRTDSAATIDAPTLTGTPSKIVEPVRYEQVADFAQPFQAPASRVPIHTDNAATIDAPTLTVTPSKIVELVRYEQVADFAQPFQAPASRVPIHTDNAATIDAPTLTVTPSKIVEPVRYEQVADFAQPFQAPASRVPIHTDNAATIDAPTLTGTPSKIVEPVRYEQVADFAQPFQAPTPRVPIRTDNAATIDAPTLTRTPSKVVEPVRYEQVADFAQPFEAAVARPLPGTDSIATAGGTTSGEIVVSKTTPIPSSRFEQVADFAQPFQDPTARTLPRTASDVADGGTTGGEIVVSKTTPIPSSRFEQVADFAQPFQSPVAKPASIGDATKSQSDGSTISAKLETSRFEETAGFTKVLKDLPAASVDLPVAQQTKVASVENTAKPSVTAKSDANTNKELDPKRAADFVIRLQEVAEGSASKRVDGAATEKPIVGNSNPKDVEPRAENNLRAASPSLPTAANKTDVLARTKTDESNTPDMFPTREGVASSAAIKLLLQQQSDSPRTVNEATHPVAPPGSVVALEVRGSEPKVDSRSIESRSEFRITDLRTAVLGNTTSLSFAAPSLDAHTASSADGRTTNITLIGLISDSRTAISITTSGGSSHTIGSADGRAFIPIVVGPLVQSVEGTHENGKNNDFIVTVSQAEDDGTPSAELENSDGAPRRIRIVGGKKTDEDEDAEGNEVVASGTTGATIFGGGSSGSNQTQTDPDQQASGASTPQNAPTVGSEPDPPIQITLPPLEITGIDASDKNQNWTLTVDEVAHACLSPLRHDDIPVVIDRTIIAGAVNSDESGGNIATRFDDQTLMPLKNRRFDDETISTAAHKQHQNSPAIEDIARIYGRKPPQDVVSESDGSAIFDVFNLERRRTYKVRPGDTLSSIAARELGNASLVPLLIQLNRDRLLSDSHGKIVLRRGAIILLPSRAEIARYLARTQPSSENYVYSSDTGELRLSYICRLGDTLKTIAKRHPAVRDARVWPLIATINGLSTAVDDRRIPVTKINRGQKLVLPNRHDCARFIYEQTFGVSDFGNDRSSGPANSQFHGDAVKSAQVPQDKTVVSFDQTPTTTLSNRSDSSPERTVLTNNNDSTPVAPDATPSISQHRVVTQADLGEGTDTLQLRLELYRSGAWCVVVEYSVSGDGADSFLSIYTAAGRRKKLPIELPDRAARELAENDLAANSEHYCHQYLKDRLPF